jgi:protoheme IX farnesyltransferase
VEVRQNQRQDVRAITKAPSYSWWKDVLMLIKIRLSFLVVFSAVMAYLIVAKGQVLISEMLVLAIGGFLVTGAGNTLNQILEKDFDKLMERTAFRPLAAERMSSSEAVMIGGILFVTGIFLLALLNPLAAVLGAIAVVSYAFLYTPLKRWTPFSVFVGAIPGALPTMIGCVALEGNITSIALILFAIQFFWQFPHFWSIGFLGYEDYQKAGFKLVPELNGKVHPNLGRQSMIFALLLLPFCIAPYFLDQVHLLACLFVGTLSIVYAFYGWKLQKNNDRKTARELMFSSFLYLPLVLIIYYLGSV